VKHTPYPAYKTSGIEWLGDIPQHWATGRVASLFALRSGGTPSTDNPDYWDGSIPWVSAKDMKALILEDTEDHISPEGLADSPAQMVPPRCVLLVTRSGILKHTLPVAVPQLAVAINQDVKALIPALLIHAEYFAYTLNGNQMALLTLWRQQGATVESLDVEAVKVTAVPLPPLPEQCAIANFLDAQTARIETLVAKKHELIEKLKEKRAALISRTVTRGLPPEAARAAGFDPHPRLKPSGVEWLGEVPEHWKTPPLYTRYSVDLGKMLNEDRIIGDHLLPYLRNVDVQWDTINFTHLPEIEVAPGESGRFTIKEGDLLVCEGGEVGRAAIVPTIREPYAYQKALHRLRPLTNHEVTRYMFYTLSCAANLGVFMAEGNPNTIPHLTGEKLRRYRFPRPPKDEQMVIAGFLDQQIASIERLVAKAGQVIDRLREYRTALITAAVAGKIDVRGIRYATKV
jgi:type I restriction enzyme S subunit